jgi:sugar/nucleoside kinase (ribokinase family)
MTNGNAIGMSMDKAPDYLAIGHISVDLRPDGGASLGGTALYSSLLASRFGLRAAVLTRGNFTRHGPEIADALSRHAEEVDIIVQEAAHPTCFTNVSRHGRREQTLHTWAGEIDLNGLPPHWRAASIIHLGPVAQEIDARRAGRLIPGYFGVTPQGWMRRWPTGRGGRVQLVPLRLPFEFLSRVDGLVLNSEEHTLARDEIDVVSRRALVAITRGSAGVQVIDRGRANEIPAFRVPIADDTGAGDVFAATMFLLRAEQTPTMVSIRNAAAASALLVQHGGPDGVPTREAVEAFLAREEGKATRRR